MAVHTTHVAYPMNTITLFTLHVTRPCRSVNGVTFNLSMISITTIETARINSVCSEFRTPFVELITHYMVSASRLSDCISESDPYIVGCQRKKGEEARKFNANFRSSDARWTVKPMQLYATSSMLPGSLSVNTNNVALCTDVATSTSTFDWIFDRSLTFRCVMQPYLEERTSCINKSWSEKNKIMCKGVA